MNSPHAWIKRRARRLVQAFQISRSEAVANAWLDWTYFYHPRTFVTVTKTPNTQDA